MKSNLCASVNTEILHRFALIVRGKGGHVSSAVERLMEQYVMNYDRHREEEEAERLKLIAGLKEKCKCGAEYSRMFEKCPECGEVRE